MRTPLRLLAFGAALVAVFTLSLVAARTLRPAAAGSAAVTAGHSENGKDGTDHSTASTAEPPGASRSGGHASGPSPDPVRGLAVEAHGYQLEAMTAPGRTGEQGTLSFRVSGPVISYLTFHEKALHLIVVRSDGSRFRHVHPAYSQFGGWSLPWRWTAAGSYRVFADFVPAATGEPLTLTSTVEVAGHFLPTAVGADTDSAAVAGYAVALDGTLRAGQESALRFAVTRDGAPVKTLQPYVGAAGHLVVLRAGDLAYLYVHLTDDEPAAAFGPDIAFTVQPPSPGRYLLYLDFQVDGQVHTAAFTVTAAH